MAVLRPPSTGDTLGLKRLDGLGSRQETLDRWQGVTGIRPTDVEWYETLAGYKLAVITGRKVMLEGNQGPRNNPNSNIITQMLARTLGWPAPKDIIA